MRRRRAASESRGPPGRQPAKRARQRRADRSGLGQQAPAAPRRRPKARDHTPQVSSSRNRVAAAPAALGFETGAGTSSAQHAVFRNKEIVFDILRSSTASFEINGSNPLFEFLRIKLATYSTYKFRKCVIRYVPRVGTGADGDVMMCFNPDANAVHPVTANDFAQTKPYVTGVPWTEHHIDLMPTMRASGPLERKVVDYDAPLQPSAIELNLYSYGRAFALTDGVGVATDVIGRMWVEYEVEAWNPREPKDPDLVASCLQGVTGTTFAQPFGTSPYTVIPSHVSALNGTEFQIRRPGSYLVTHKVYGTSSGFVHQASANPSTTTPVAPTLELATALPGPKWRKWTGNGYGDSGWWELDAVGGNRATATKLLTISKPENFSVTPTIVSTGGSTVNSYTVDFSPFSGDTFGWESELDEEDSDTTIIEK